MGIGSSSPMAPTETSTSDPFGLVGSYVLRVTQRKGRRRQRSGSGSSNAMKPDPGAIAEDGSDDENGGVNVTGMVLHGWVTRYDARLDAYTLFEPSTSRSTLFSRDEVTKLASNPEFQLRKEADAAFPPPVEDTGSRFVDAPVRKATRDASGREQEEVEGRVVSFLPFADAYRVAFDDGSVEELSESEVVDALLLFAKRTKPKETTSERQENGTEAENDAYTETEPSPVETEVMKGRKRRRSEDFTPDTRVSDVEDDGEETEDEEPPPELLRNAVVKREAWDSAQDDTSQAAAAPAPPPVNVMDSEPPPVPENDEVADVKMQPVLQVDSSAWQPDAIAEETSAVPTAVETAAVSSTPILPEPPVEPPAQPPVEDEDMGMDIDVEEPMDIPTREEDDDEDVHAVTASLASTSTTSTSTEPFVYIPPAPVPSVPIPEVISLLDDYSVTKPSLPLPLQRLPTPSGPPPLSYIVDVQRHVATTPLDKRSMAFEFVRAELTRLIESDECKQLEIKLVADVLSNRDIKDRDAIRRFVETGGLVAVNRVLNVRASDALATKTLRCDRVLFVLKLLAMLPTPSEQQVMESVIGKTIGRFIKSRLTDQQTQADPEMPKTIPHLAKWIKHKWVANMKRSGANAPKPAEEARRKTPVMPSKSSSSASANASKTTKKHLQRPMHGRPPGQRSNDPEPIPRLAPRPSTPLPPAPPPVLSFAAASAPSSAAASSPSGGDMQSSRGQPSPAKSSLKPDWMRQKEAQSRSRFTIATDANAERQHYRQRERANATTQNNGDASSSGSSNSAASANAPRAPPLMENPGDRGVFGRSQRLAFGPRWNVCEFFKDAPPSAVRRVASTASSSSLHRPNAGGQPKPILRRTSKYNDELRFGI